MKIKKLKPEAIRTFLQAQYPDEAWEDADDDLVRLCLTERAFEDCELTRDNTNQRVLYTGIYS